MDSCSGSRTMAAMKFPGFVATALLSLAAGVAVADEPALQEAPGQAAQSGDTTDAGAARPAVRRTGQHTAQAGIDARVRLLAKELNLDERQQGEVRKILVRQREEVKQAWSDESVPAEVRVATMRAAGDRTAARIRAILTDSQREKYIKSRPAVPANPQSASDLNTWIGAVGSK